MIADDQRLFRRGLAGLLAQDSRIQLAGEADDGSEALALVARSHPDVVLMDIRMPKVDGIEATRAITRDHPKVRVLILSTFENDGYVMDAMKAGAAGYVLKDADADAIVNSVLTVCSGEGVVALPVARRLLGMLTGKRQPLEDYDGLTSRELQVLTLLSSGLANKQIAYRLRISEKTARNHVSRIYAKLRIVDRAHAVLYAVKKGLIEP